MGDISEGVADTLSPAKKIYKKKVVKTKTKFTKPLIKKLKINRDQSIFQRLEPYAGGFKTSSRLGSFHRRRIIHCLCLSWRPGVISDLRPNSWT
jgi:hypothetical protein